MKIIKQGNSFIGTCVSIIKKNPLIGVCVSNAKRGMQRILKERLERYSGEITLIMFHIENLDFDNLQVKGEYLEKRGREINQKQGIFPFPDVIYLQCHVDHEDVIKMEQLIGHKVFNNFIFDKWELWNILKNYSGELHPFLPHTRKLKNRKELQRFLYVYKDIFLKPIDVTQGHSSKGIFRVRLQKNGSLEVTYRKKRKMHRKSFEYYSKFINWIYPKLTKEYIIQQSIQTVTWNQKVTDIRLNMNKNDKGKWEVSALFARIALAGNHIGPGRGILYMPLEIRQLIRKTLPGRRGEKEDKIKSVVDLGFKICNALDKSGHHLADIGIDIGIDKSGNPWIFEVNPIPCPFALPIEDHSSIRPLEYALYLASN
ncbi:YheC/YheD family protein [Priestia megaterium]|uniref:YheC/YheD family protein n=1 Tax=Priestia megaterium TaxID=1404 RepID=UPI003EEB043F